VDSRARSRLEVSLLTLEHILDNDKATLSSTFYTLGTSYSKSKEFVDALIQTGYIYKIPITTWEERQEYGVDRRTKFILRLTERGEGFLKAWREFESEWKDICDIMWMYG